MYPHGLSLSETRAVVREHNELHNMKLFVEADRGDHVIFNYLVSTPFTFPAFTGDPVQDRKSAILRECRGVTFDAHTGECIARKFQKFFNLNQVPETQIAALDFSRPHVIMDKLDGSMITPFRVSTWDQSRWGTKMGLTDVAIPVEQHIAPRPEYAEFAIMCETAGFTPLFEWTSRQQRIVIDYPEDRLVLLHLRNIYTGDYAPRKIVNDLAEQYNIPVVDTIEATIDDIDAFVEMTRGLKNLEGYVVQFADETRTDDFSRVEMLKLKADDYCSLHNTKEALNLEKNVVAMVVGESLDDLLPQMDEGDRAAVSRFSDDLMLGAQANAATAKLQSDVFKERLARENITDPRELKKRYAAMVNSNDYEYATPHAFYKGLLFRAFTEDNLLPEVLKIIGNHTASSSRIEEIRPLMGSINWQDYRGVFDAEA